MPVTLFQCKPVDGYWERFSSLDPTHPDCIVHTNAFADGSGVPNIITDILMLLLPLLFVWQLQLRNSQMIALLGVFALGIFNIIISIVRLVYTLKFSLVSPDYTWDFTQAGFWTMLECSLAIICANLPTLRPLLDLLLHGAIQGRSRSLRPQPMSGKLAPSPFPASVHARLPPKNGSIWPSVKSASGSEEEDEDHLLRRDSEDPWVIRGDAKSVAPGRSTERSPQAHKAGEQVDLELRDLEGGVKRAINVGAFTPLDGREERQIDM
ncbi:MAG: hypothetical protein M1822_003223 [Bathelium mastoideum]|nr:MAG: hypothetical protein M1822_003223 [Bathelium mastoideum]